MDAIKTESWEDFEEKLKKLRAENGTETTPLLFRGQGNSEWHLETTLERYTKKEGMTFLGYYDLITGSIGPEVRTFSGVDVPERRRDVAESFFDKGLMFKWPRQFPDLPLYSYMAHLRQLGFPSPLLDWSESPYVAAFFAFREGSPTAKRSIYAYCAGTLSGGTLYKPMILPLGHYIHTHHRHFRQRSEYTFCGNFAEWDAQWRFDSHEKVFENRRPNQDQDLVWKFDIPSSERDKVLGILSDYNLNAFSLFGSEETLLETMWYREYPRQTKPVMVESPLASKSA
jgi:hypothetical protein